MCKRILTILMIIAAVALIGCEKMDLGTMPEQIDPGGAALDQDLSSASDSDPDVYVEKSSCTREVIQYTVEAWGHSCASIRPKKKAENRAIVKAKAKIMELYNTEIASRIVTIPADAYNRAEKVRAYGTMICEAEDFDFMNATVHSNYEYEVIDERDGADCGKDVKISLTGNACLICYDR